MTPYRCLHRINRVRNAIQRSVATKLIATVGLGVLAIVLMYTHLIAQIRGAWFAERLNLSQVLIQEEISDYYEQSGGKHPLPETRAFLDRLASESGIDRVQIVAPEASRAPDDSTREFADLPGAIGFAPRGDGAALAPPEPPPWRAVVPLATKQTCISCHGATNPLASIVIDFPRARITSMQRSARLELLGYGTAVLVFTLAILIISIWWLVLEPLYRLSDTVERARLGDLCVTCDVRGDDQFGRLAGGLNAMLATIRNRNARMEEGFTSTIARAERLATVGQLASGLAHEIKNPLHSVASALSIVKKRVDDPQLRAVTDDMQDEIQRVVGIVQDLLQYARPKAAETRPVNLPAVVEQTVRLLHSDAARRGIALHVHSADDLPPALVDADQVHQILLNLILNAIQAGHEAGRVDIRLSAAPDSRYLWIDVDDDGPGIPADQRDAIFEPFYTTRHDGHGLGLPITCSLARQNGGGVELLDRPGPGTCFRIALPSATDFVIPVEDPHA